MALGLSAGSCSLWSSHSTEPQACRSTLRSLARNRTSHHFPATVWASCFPEAVTWAPADEWRIQATASKSFTWCSTCWADAMFGVESLLTVIVEKPAGPRLTVQAPTLAPLPEGKSVSCRFPLAAWRLTIRNRRLNLKCDTSGSSSFHGLSIVARQSTATDLWVLVQQHHSPRRAGRNAGVQTAGKLGDFSP